MVPRQSVSGARHLPKTRPRQRLERLRIAPVLVLGGALTLISGVYVSILLADDPALVNWSFTHWAFTYDYGLVKRGLAGEILSWVVEPSALFSAVEWIALFNATGVAAGLIFFIWRPFFRYGGAGLLAFAILATTHFATLQHFFYDVGRFDHLGLMLALLCISCIEWSHGTTAVVAVLLCGSTGVLIHEAFAVAHAPVVFAYWLYSIPATGDARLTRMLPVAMVALLLGILVVVMSMTSPSIDQNALVAQLTAKHGSWIQERSVSVLFGGAATETPRSIQIFFTAKRLVQHVVLAGFLIPTVVLFAKAILRRETTMRPAQPGASKAGILVLAALSPLSLYVVGVDFARWWALAITNVLLAVALLMARSDTWRIACDRTMLEHRVWVWSALALNFLTGPLGVAASAFPRLEPLVNAAVLTAVRAVRG